MPLQEGRIDTLPELDSTLRNMGIAAILFGGVARQVHDVIEGKKKPANLRPRKDVDILITNDVLGAHCDRGYARNWDELRKLLKFMDPLRRIDFFVRSRFPENEEYNYHSMGKLGVMRPFWFYRNICNRAIPHWLLDGIETVELPPGLHVPTRAFLNGLDASITFAQRYYNPRTSLRALLPQYLGHKSPQQIADAIRKTVDAATRVFTVDGVEFPIRDFHSLKIVPLNYADHAILNEKDWNRGLLILALGENAWNVFDQPGRY